MRDRESPGCLVVGNGPVGVSLVSRLKMLGFDHYFLGRRGQFSVSVRFEGWNAVHWLDVKSLAEADVSQVGIVFMAVKAYDLKGAIRRYIPYLPKGIPVVPVSNGAVEDIIKDAAQAMPAYKWRLGYCTFGVSAISPGNYALLSKVGKAWWGPFIKQGGERSDPRTPIEKEIFRRDQGAFFDWLDPVLPSLRKKWLYNVVINTLTAVKSIQTNGELLNNMDELILVYEEAYRLGLELWGSWDHSHDKMFEEMISLISATAANENSMARDVRLGRRTESGFLAGLAKGKRGYPLLEKYHSAIVEKSPKNTVRI